MNANPPRLASLDLLRGSAVALMILVNNPGSWSYLYPPLAHAPWHGLTPTDLVFPFFLFAVGQALALTLPPLLQAGATAFWRKWLWRVGMIFALGLLLSAAPGLVWNAAGELVVRDWSGLRIMGVLQRIALAWGLAALLLAALAPRAAAHERPSLKGPASGDPLAWPGPQPRAALAAAIGLLVVYHAICVAFAQGPDPYGLEGFFGTHLDRALLGATHLYRGEGVPFDPEGLGSTLPAVAQVLLGAWATLWLRAPASDPGLSISPAGRALLAGCAMLAAGLVWADLMPINKKLWTSSYVLVTTGLALALLAALMWLYDPRPSAAPAGRAAPFHDAPRWRQGFAARTVTAFGRNALFVFVLSGLVPRLLGLVRIAEGPGPDGTPRWLTPLPWLWRHGFEPLAFDRRLGSLAFAVAHLAVYAALALWLDRRRVYIRI